ncbi:hypothetical protein [Qipengyuania sp. JC766]|uniref:hypothetical protein n=1 Tax=Qipengyuania sp. JC766 TaxID=3232139 RepID=UPI003458A2BA
MMKQAALALLALAFLSACTSSAAVREYERRVDRVLQSAPGKAQPSKIVAREIAFARTAREDGQWTAYREFAGSAARIHLADGVVEAGSWLSGRPDPAEAIQWNPRLVWMSCDARNAVSRGRYVDGEGRVGTYVTVWESDDGEDYEWVYNTMALDDPQPAPAQQAEEGLILVTAPELVSGRVTDCPGSANPLPEQPDGIVPAPASTGSGRSADGALTWRWMQYDSGERAIAVDAVTGGAWERVIDQRWPTGSPR